MPPPHRAPVAVAPQTNRTKRMPSPSARKAILITSLPERPLEKFVTFVCKSSFNVQKVMWLVGELGIAHRHIEVGGAFGGLDEPAFRAMNPHGRVPVIVD